VRTDLPFPGYGHRPDPRTAAGIEAYTVKVNANFPGARPALRGVICLHSGVDGELPRPAGLRDGDRVAYGLAAALGTHSWRAGDGAVLGVIARGRRQS